MKQTGEFSCVTVRFHGARLTIPGELGGVAPLSEATLSEDDRWIFAVSNEAKGGHGSLYVFDARDVSQPAWCFQSQSGAFTKMAVNSDHTELAIGTDQGKVLWIDMNALIKKILTPP